MHSRSGKISDSLQQHALDILGNSFKGIDREAITELLDASTWITLKGGEMLFLKGQKGNSLFLLIQGRMKALRTENGVKKVIGELNRGELIGEMGAISGNSRSADVVACRDCHLVMISINDFYRLSMKNPSLGWSALQMVVERVMPEERPRKLRGVRNVAIVLGDPSIDLKSFMSELSISFSNLMIKTISQGQDEDHLSPPEGWNDEVKQLGWVEQLERENDLLLFLTDPVDIEWSRFCVRQADEIVILIRDPESINENFIGQILPFRSSVIDKTLLILHGDSADIPTGTSRYFEKAEFDFHFHLREGRDEDMNRFKRHLRDEQTGLVLAGGGARGIAHVGVWKALQELHVPVDWIGGTSMGAFLGGVMALGKDFETIYEIVKEICLSNPSSDYNPVPYASLIHGKNLDRILQKHYKAYDILDCPTSFFCISTDITNMRPAVHRRGNMYRAIRASGSLPAIVPPVPINNNWHVDGGIVDNFPVQDMIDVGAQKIIGVSFESGNNDRTSSIDIPSFWTQIKYGLFNRNQSLNIPTIFDTIMLSTTANSAQKQRSSEKKVDTLITPDVGNFGLLEWTAYDKVIKAGYEATMEAFESLKD